MIKKLSILVLFSISAIPVMAGHRVSHEMPFVQRSPEEVKKNRVLAGVGLAIVTSYWWAPKVYRMVKKLQNDAKNGTQQSEKKR